MPSQLHLRHLHLTIIMRHLHTRKTTTLEGEVEDTGPIAAIEAGAAVIVFEVIEVVEIEV